MSSFTNSRGFTMIEAMVAVAILSIVAAATASLMSQQNMESRALSERLANQDLQRQVIAALSDPVICATEFTTPNLSQAIVFNPSTVSVTNPFVVPITRLAASAVPGGPLIAQVGQTPSSLSNSLKIKTMNLRIISPLTATLDIEVDETKLIRPLRTMSYVVALQTIGSGANTTVVGCKSSMQAAALCEQLGGIYDPTQSPQCKLGGSCSSGEVMIANTNGQATCRNLGQMLASLCPSGTIFASQSGGLACVASTGTPSPQSSPPPPDYSNWTVYTVNNLPNGRGTWFSTITGARPNASATFIGTQATIDGVSNLGSPTVQPLGTVQPDGSLNWGGQLSCPTGSTCSYSWNISIDGISRSLSATVRP